MGRLAILLLLTALAAPGAERWVRIETGPFEIVSNAGDKPARHAALLAEQLRNTFGELVGIKDPAAVWPIRIVIAKIPQPLRMGRDSWISAMDGVSPLTPEWRRAVLRILIDDNIGRMPSGIESGLIALLSTLETEGTRQTLGTPPEERTRDWARLHLYATQADYTGRLRILLTNLARGANFDAACRNAFEKPAAEMEKRVDAYFAAGQFSTVPYPGRAMAERDFVVREIDASLGALMLADLAASDPAKSAQALAAYQSIDGAGAMEGLALLRNSSELAQKATAAGSKNPRTWLATGTKEGAIRAIELNPKWPAPHLRLAELAEAPNVKAAETAKAAQLARRDAGLWKQAALAHAAASQFVEAGKARVAAEAAAADETERATIAEARRANDVARVEAEAAERKRIANEEARALEELKQKGLAEVRAAESKARSEMRQGGAVPEKTEKWWDGPEGPTAKAQGVLARVECLAGGRAKVIITTGPKTALALAVRDASKIVLMGGGVNSLGCGVQSPARKVTVEYVAVKDPKLATAGDLHSVEFE